MSSFAAETLPSFLLGLKKDKKCIFCYRVLQYIRHIKPIYWVAILAVAITLFIVFVPVRFWTYILSATQEHKLLVGMLALFCIVSLSLIWAAGQRIDAAVFHFFNRFGNQYRWLDNIMRMLTELGNSIATTAVAIFLYIAIHPNVAFSFVLGSLFLWLIVELIKTLLRRSRPFTRLEKVNVIGQRARGKSFPSGHTSQAFFTATLVLQYMDGGVPVYFVLYALAVAVGITRMFLGMHYPRDVLGGAILGSFLGMIEATLSSHILDLII